MYVSKKYCIAHPISFTLICGGRIASFDDILDGTSHISSYLTYEGSGSSVSCFYMSLYVTIVLKLMIYQN